MDNIFITSGRFPKVFYNLRGMAGGRTTKQWHEVFCVNGMDGSGL